MVEFVLFFTVIFSSLLIYDEYRQFATASEDTFAVMRNDPHALKSRLIKIIVEIATLALICNRPLIGYYLEFDMAMINRLVKPWLGVTLPNKQIEVSGLYFDKKIALIPQGNIDLRFDTILRDLNIPRMGQHNALNDAIMTAMIYIKLQQPFKLH
jgi:DNA polymerase-3 subunit epsilon